MDDVYRALAEADALGALDGGSPAGSPPDGLVRQQLLDLAQAPPAPIDRAAHPWQEIAPGLKVHVMREDAERRMKACLVWAVPGTKSQRHRHGGDEVILVLEGSLRDHRATYGPGDICRSRAGSIHTEVVPPGDDCFCYVVYYGDIEELEDADGPAA